MKNNVPETKFSLERLDDISRQIGEMRPGDDRERLGLEFAIFLLENDFTPIMRCFVSEDDSRTWKQIYDQENKATRDAEGQPSYDRPFVIGPAIIFKEEKDQEPASIVIKSGSALWTK